MGEESTNTDAQRKEFSTFIKALDPYDHPIVSHTLVTEKEAVFGPLLGYDAFDGAAVHAEPENIFDDVLEWVQRSAAAGKKWIVANDEQSPSAVGGTQWLTVV